MLFNRRQLFASAACLTTAPAVHAQAPEKPKTTIAVGGENLLYGLPMTVAEQRGCFKAKAAT